MFAKYKNKDNVFKDLIMYQKPLKTLYQQLVINGYTDTEEQFLDKVLKIVQGKERQEIDDSITSLTKDLENTNSILNSVKTMSEKNKSDISKNKRNINDLADEVISRCDYLYGRIDSTDDEVEDINNNRLPKDGLENQVLLKGNDKNIWKSLDEIPLTMADVSTDNEILAIFQIKSQPFTLGKILTEGSEIEIYIDGVLSNDLAKKNEDGELTFQLANNSNKTVDIEIYGDREKDIIKYNQNFLKTITYIDEMFLNYDPYGKITWLRTPAFFSNNDNLRKVGKIVIGDKALNYSAKDIFAYDSYLEEVLEVDLGPCTDLSSMFQGCFFAVNFSLLKMDTSNVTDMSYMFEECRYLTKIPLLDTSNVKTMYHMFVHCYKLSSIPQMNTSNVTDMENMFSGCTSLTTIPLLDTSNVTDMSYMFEECSNLTTIPLLNTSNVTDIYSMFKGCRSLTTIPLLDTSKVESMQSMFKGCRSLTTIPLLDTSKVESMQSMFEDCSSLTTIPLLDTSNTTDMKYMFNGCSSLTNIPQLNTSKVSDMYGMFYNCSSLTTIPQLDTSNVRKVFNMFNGCTSLTTIPLLDTSKVEKFYMMFLGCSSLTTIPQLDMSNATSTDRMFVNCISLQQLPKLNSINVADMQYMFAGCTSLTRIEGLNVSKTQTIDSMFSNCNNLSYINLISNNVNNLQGVINQLPIHEGAATDAYIIDLTECTIDVSSITAPAGWTIKLPTSGGGE